jgi:hypothetical protein
MLRDSYRCGAAAWRVARGVTRTTLVIASAGLVSAGCTTSGQPVLGAAGIGGPGIGGSGLRTVAFESIDGPPEQLFRKLVTQLGQEANARQVAMVSRESPAQFRIRGYVAAHVQGQKTTITWVWDVYDADRERAVRLAGEVPGAPSERAWAAADDAVVSRIARDGMNRLAAYLAGPGPAPPVEFSPPREETSPAVASMPNREGSLAFLPPSRP